MLPRPLWAALKPSGRHLLHDTTVGTLPPALREKLGLEWSASDEQRLQRVAAAVRAATMLVPDRALHYPLAYQAVRAAKRTARGLHGLMAKSSGRLLAMVRSAPADPDQTAVLDAALDAFLDFGVRRASMGEIAKRSRLSPATLYRRFAQKSDIVQAVGLREVQRFLADVDRRVDHSASAEDQLAELFVAVCGGIRRHRLLRRLIDTEPEVVLPLLTTQGGPVLDLGRDYVAEFIRRLQGDGRPRGLRRGAGRRGLRPARAVHGADAPQRHPDGGRRGRPHLRPLPPGAGLPADGQGSPSSPRRKPVSAAAARRSSAPAGRAPDARHPAICGNTSPTVVSRVAPSRTLSSARLSEPCRIHSRTAALAIPP